MKATDRTALACIPSVGYETWYKMTVMLQSGLDITPVITHRLHYTEFQKGFEVMNTGESAKVVLNWI
jgi:threonine 3-dehydrogenase